MWGFLIAIVVGIAYGYMSPGKQDKSFIFKRGLLWGLLISVVVALLGYFFHANPLGLADTSFFGLFLSFVVLTLVFILGVWVGDMIEGRKGRTTGMRRV